MAGKRTENWDFWRDTEHSPALNMALDDVLLQQACSRNRPLLRFYKWDRLAVSIGYVQSHSSAPGGYAVVRRPTGGGIVYHDHDFTYSVIVPNGHWLTGLDRNKSYDWINRSVSTGLQKGALTPSLADAEIPSHIDRKTMVCFKNPTRYDILLGGQKIAGSAQRRTKNGILHQGSIHFGGEMPFKREDLVTLLKTGFEEVMSVRFSGFLPDTGLLQKAAELASTQYETEEWNQRR